MGLLHRSRPDPTEVAQALADEIGVLEVIAALGGTVFFGAPTRCPDCTDFGLVESVDEAAGVQRNRCLACGATWVITRRALHELRHQVEVMERARGARVVPIDVVTGHDPEVVVERLTARLDERSSWGSHDGSAGGDDRSTAATTPPARPQPNWLPSALRPPPVWAPTDT